MTTTAIIAIVIAALLIIAVVAFMLPRMRRKAQIQKRERELQQRRDRVAGEHRAEAEAARAPGQSRPSSERGSPSGKPRPSAPRRELHQERAGLHERGMADDELIDESEREKFAGTSAMSTDRDGDGVDDSREATADGRQDRDADGVDDRQRDDGGWPSGPGRRARRRLRARPPRPGRRRRPQPPGALQPRRRGRRARPERERSEQRF